MTANLKVMEGNEAVAHIAYRATEINVIYPITPSTTMGELADQWATEGIKNIWNSVPRVIEMQSEGGAAGALHGALQTGALATTYTASQGLLLMLPNMHKIAGELNPAVIHVSARSLACQGLSIFGDHSDVMGIRNTGFGMLASGSVQEAHDLALIAHASTLEARIPFIHFFEGFRVSHEINKINVITNEQIRMMIDENLVMKHRLRALNPDHPSIRGTAQNPDVYFQGRESSNLFYINTPKIVEKYMEYFYTLTGRKYSLINYYGAKDADQVIVIIGSGAKVVEQTVDKLNKIGKKVGVIQIYLYRPFPIDDFVNKLPTTVKKIAVLDRTKEPGSIGEPLYQDIVTALSEKNLKNISVIGGRYGLSSKEFTPAMAKGVFDNLESSNSKNHFTVGINDDITNTSLDYDKNFICHFEDQKSAIFYGLGSDGTVGANKNTIKIIGEETDLHVQAYFVYDSKKSGSKTTSYLRFSKNKIVAPYLIDINTADFIACHQFKFINSDQMLDRAAIGATFLLNSPFGINDIWYNLPRIIIEKIIKKQLKFYIIDAYSVAMSSGLGNRINTIMQTCFFAISGVLPKDEAIIKIKETIVKTYKRKGDEIVKQNFDAVDNTLANLFYVPLINEIPKSACEITPIVSEKAPEFVRKIIGPMLSDCGDDLPVSAMSNDGVYPSGTTQWEKRNVSNNVSEWNSELCIQCGQCSLICPHGVIRTKHFSNNITMNAPECFKTSKCKISEFNNDDFRLQIYLEDCTGCGLCNEVCPGVDKTDKTKKAIMITSKESRLDNERRNINYFENIPYEERQNIDMNNARMLQYVRPYFEFSSACAGCGETPYLKLVTQLFGDRMLVANATGCSSIYGGNLPTTPWCSDINGRGPAWSNSLFEDNAEFGYGFKLSDEKQKELAIELLKDLSEQISSSLVNEVIAGSSQTDEKSINEQRNRLIKLKNILLEITDDRAKHLIAIMDHLVKRSIWIIGGDGWAYDIGYGGLDHVLASGNDVNVLVLDTEVYSNTGGQASKSTPRAAVAKFAASGKPIARKDLGMIAMTYGNIYVAQISLGANPLHAIKAMIEAENYNGPSLVIAYSHCIAHGYDLRHGVEQQKLAVGSGFWPLYRYNPDLVKKGMNPFQLDSKAPKIEISDYCYNEPRFKVLKTQDIQRAEFLLKQLQEDVNRRWKLLSEMTIKNS